MTGISGIRTSDTGPLRLVYFGRLTAYKGVDRMVHVMSLLEAKAPGRFTLDIIGAGEEIKQLRLQIDALNLQSVVKLLGAMPFGAEFFAKLQHYDILLACPLSPDTPRSALDAMAAGLALVAYDTDYYRELQLQSTAVRTTPWLDDNAMMKELLALEEDRGSLVELRRAAVAFAAANTQQTWLEKRAAWTREFCLET